MLILRPNCEHCDKDLPYNATDAMICSFECTFCQRCVESLLQDVCPNCGGGFAFRPIRPQASLAEHPASILRVVKPINSEDHKKRCRQYGSTSPEDR